MNLSSVKCVVLYQTSDPRQGQHSSHNMFLRFFNFSFTFRFFHFFSLFKKFFKTRRIFVFNLIKSFMTSRILRRKNVSTT